MRQGSKVSTLIGGINPENDDYASGSRSSNGAAYEYRFNEGQNVWTRTTVFHGTYEEGCFQYFGSSFALAKSLEKLIVKYDCATQQGVWPTYSGMHSTTLQFGAPYVFERAEGSWAQSWVLTQPGQKFDDLGRNIAVSWDGKVIAAGCEDGVLLY